MTVCVKCLDDQQNERHVNNRLMVDQAGKVISRTMRTMALELTPSGHREALIGVLDRARAEGRGVR
jgi:hypothetical protein